MNEEKYNAKQLQDQESIKRIENTMKEIDEYLYKYGHKVLLGGILFLRYKNEVLSLFGGSNKKFMQFQSAYTLHFEGIKMAVDNKDKRYNFYGITGNFNKENPLYGLYLFKKSFGGNVEELVGEFDLIIRPVWYQFYKFILKVYKKLKKKR